MQKVESDAQDAAAREIGEQHDEASLVRVSDAGAGKVAVVVATRDARVTDGAVVRPGRRRRGAGVTVPPISSRAAVMTLHRPENVTSTITQLEDVLCCAKSPDKTGFLRILTES